MSEVGSEDLYRKLQQLEQDYHGQPIIGQKTDLIEINKLRSQLGMELVDSNLKTPTANRATSTPTKPTDDSNLAGARELYRDYLKKLEYLRPHQEYAKRVIAAPNTKPGELGTPVKPLVTMGTNKGALLCDHCLYPMFLEGGQTHGYPVDVAWGLYLQSSNAHGWDVKILDDWRSWIHGGLVVETQLNGTLRIYHGYPESKQTNYCCIAVDHHNKRMMRDFLPLKCHVPRTAFFAFFEKELPQLTKAEQIALYDTIIDTIYGYDPGIGVNRPS